MRPSSEALARPAPPGDRWMGRIARHNELALLLFLVAVIAFFASMSEPFLSVRNLTNVLGQASITLVAGIGLALVLMSGEVDISIGSTLAAVAIPLIEVMNATGSLGLGVAAALAMGAVIGCINGLLAAYLRINSLIVTLGTLFVIRGLVYLYTGKTAIADDAMLESFFQLGNGSLGQVMPFPALIAAALLAVAMYVMRHRRFGRQVYATGSDSEVARLAGFPVRRIKFTCFVVCSLLATLAGILLASRVGSAVHVAGLNFEFQVVAAVVLGGVSLSGGTGSMLGMALGVLILSFVSNGLGMLNLPTEWQLVITGLVIIAAVALDEAKKRQP